MPCNIDYYDGSNPDFYVSKNIISRKEHRCCECYETIPIKTRYQNITGKWDGSILRYKTCSICAELREILFANQLYYTELWDQLNDCIDDLTINDIDKLSESAIEKLENKIDHLFDREENND